VNSGTISGGTNGDGSGIALGASFSGNSDVLVNLGSGVINGGVDMTGSNNSATLFTGSVINGALNMGADTQSLLTLDGAGTSVFSSAVTGTTTLAGQLTKQGAGIWTIDRTLNASSVTISAGTLQVGNGGTTGSVGSVNITNNGTLAFNRSDNLTNGSTISGAGSLSKAGAGTMILGAANTYTGGTTINAGALQIGNGGTTGSLGSGAITNNGSLAVNRSDAVSLANTISGTGNFTQAGVGTTILSGANTYSGTTTISAGTLLFSNANSLYGGNNSLWTAANLIVSSNATAAFGVGGASSFTTSNITTLLGNLTTVNNNGLQAGSSIGFDTTAGDFILTNTIADSTGTGGGSLGLTKLGLGTLTLSGSNSYTGGTKLIGGTLTAGNLYAFGTGAVTVGLNTFLDMANYSIANTLSNNGGTILNAGTISGGDFTGGTTDLSGNNSTVAEVSGTATVNVSGTGTTITNVAGGTVNVNGASTTIQSYNGGSVAVGSGLIVAMNDGNSSGVISGDGSMTKNSVGTLTLGGVNTYTGATTVGGGLLVVNGSIASSPVTIQSGGTLGGSGTVGAVTVQSGGTINPGNSPGTLNINGDIDWLGGGNYNWQIAGVTGTAGTVSTWDLVSATGVLDLTALTTSSKFNINLWSLSSTSPSDVSGALTGFDNTQNYTWKIATAAGGITNFSSSYFNFNTGATNGTGGFANALNGGSFSLAQSGNDLNLVFTSASAPIPEPGTWAAMAIFAGGAAYAGWRRRKSAKVAL